ncbi:MAG: AEC family transporter [Firmicutes bacterium]|nr:AEC family transporter [Lachnospiraceae bacterium]MBQ7057673.1 AEC family transporter [Bacillota bacterium]
MKLTDLFSLQGTLFALMLIGAFFKKRGIISEEGKKCLSDLCLNIIIPCNIFKSCLIDLEPGIFRTCGLLLVSGLFLQLMALGLNRVLYNRCAETQKKVLQYCTLVPMSGFLGNPIAEGLYSSVGVLYTSIFLIPMRIIMWSAGTSYFVAGKSMDTKKVLKNVLTHPCLVAIYLGLICMITQVELPKVLTETVRYIGNCNTCVTMFIVGTILADVKLSTLFSRTTLLFSGLRLVLLPALAFGFGLLLGLDKVSLGVSVLMTGMPAGATAAIFAARYDSDALFATRCVVLTTLLSMLTLPLWSWIVG